MPATREKKTASGNKNQLYYCTYLECDFKSRTKSGLLVHLNTIHYGLKPYWCAGEITKKGEPCNQSFSDPGNFLRHRVRIHGYVPKSSSRKKKGTVSQVPEIANAQLGSDINSISQLKPAASLLTETLDALQQKIDVEVDEYDKTYFASARNLRGDAHYDEKEFIPAIRSIYSPFEDQSPHQLLVDPTLLNAQPENLPFPLVNIFRKDAPPSSALESRRIAMNYTNLRLHPSLTVGFDIGSTTFADGLQSIYPASLIVSQSNAAYGVETISPSTLSKTRSVESSSRDAYDIPSIDPDVALDTFLLSLEPASEPASPQAPSVHAPSEGSSHESYYSAPSIYSDETLSRFLDSLELKSLPPSQEVPSTSAFNLASYRLNDLGSYGISTFNFGG
ncbi:hypothetical protein EDD18DRAFT_1356375 [Armillaria luteobubalina]|uniref:C2H2-type domain-containing protein n=1 Tax=Armillaria luteobubalina TaxID=153913 RepID=A0AA39UL64_9AGAR|nr:hypothetical protein EDD18DRAFT_1356375 [Armillaria luteobubalina]